MRSHLVLSTAIWLTLIGIAAPASAGHLPQVQQELNQHRLAWQAAGSVDYDFRFQRICFCVPDYTQPGLVHVRGGRIDSVEHPNTGAALDPEIYRTVGDMFDTAQEALDSDAIEVRLEYDPVLDYPTSLFIDIHRQLADDEIIYLAGGLKVLPRRPSDLTNNGFVDFDDLFVLLSNWDEDVVAALGNLVDPDTTPVDAADLFVLLSEWTGPDPNGSPEAALGAEQVPEPSSFILAALGLLGLPGFARRRRK